MQITRFAISAALMVTVTGSAASREGAVKMGNVYEVSTYGAKADGTTDSTSAIQTACDEAGKLGGVVSIPPGRYMVKGSIKVSVGVHIKGVAVCPQYSEPLAGSIILATGGRDDEDGPALFEMGNSCSVTGLTVYYPEQTVKDIRPYSWTFHMQGSDNTVENVTLINSYNGIKVGPEPNVRHRIRSVYGCVLRRGIFIDNCTDIGRVDNVQLHGHWWWAKEVGGDAGIVNKFMIENLEAFVFGRTDWEYVNNTFVFPTNIGYRFIATKTGSCNGQFSGIGSDYSHRCVVVDAIQPMGLLITNGQFVAFAGDNPIEVVIEKTCTGSVRFVNCAFWGPSVQNMVSHGQGYLSLSDCYLSSWREGNTSPLVEVDGGKLQLRGCTFATPGPSVWLRKGLQHAIVTENNGAEGVAITNEIGDAAIIANNEPAK